MNFFQTLKDNVDMKTVVSSVVASAVIGVFVMIAVKSGIKPLQTVAKVVK